MISYERMRSLARVLPTSEFRGVFTLKLQFPGENRISEKIGLEFCLKLTQKLRLQNLVHSLDDRSSVRTRLRIRALRSTLAMDAAPMTDLVLIPFPGIGTLAMTREQFESALAAGRALSPAPASHAPKSASDELVDAECMEKRTGVPASWWMAQARERRIPSQKIGRRVRFDPVAVLESEAFRMRSLPRLTQDSRP